MRCDSAMASIYDESGLEIENVELLFTEEGSILFVNYLTYEWRWRHCVCMFAYILLYSDIYTQFVAVYTQYLIVHRQYFVVHY